MNGVDIVFLLIFLTVGGLLLYGRVIKPAIYSSAKKKTANLCSYYSGTLKLLKRDPELSAVLTVDEDKDTIYKYEEEQIHVGAVTVGGVTSGGTYKTGGEWYIAGYEKNGYYFINYNGQNIYQIQLTDELFKQAEKSNISQYLDYAKKQIIVAKLLPPPEVMQMGKDEAKVYFYLNPAKFHTGFASKAKCEAIYNWMCRPANNAAEESDPGESSADAVNGSVAGVPTEQQDDICTLSLRNSFVGKTYRYGKYDWIVLKKENDKALIMSRDCVNNLAYNQKQEETSWERCSLRKWINSTFIEEAFSSELAQNILNLELLEDCSYTYAASAEKKSADKAYLLSVTEAKEYFPYSNDRIAQYNGKPGWPWWLRNTGKSADKAVDITHDGFAESPGAPVTYLRGVRPVMWIRLKDHAEIVKNYKDDMALADYLDSIGTGNNAGSTGRCRSIAEEVRNEGLYNSAIALMSPGMREGYANAIDIFKTIPDFKDSEEQIRICEDSISELDEKARLAQEEEEKKARKKSRRIIAIVAPIIIALVGSAAVYVNVIRPNNKYESAMEAIENGDYIGAYEKLMELGSYKDSSEKADEIYEEYKLDVIRHSEVGDVVIYGAFEQDNDTSNGKEEIEWIVLDKEDNRVLVISKLCLDALAYNSKDSLTLTWGTSYVRKWLNNDFYNSAFSNKQKENILKTELVNNDLDSKAAYETNGGANTEDNVFLLSGNEYEKYFSSDSENAVGYTTEYAKGHQSGQWAVNGRLVNKKDADWCWWWLRTRENWAYNAGAYMVNQEGEMFSTLVDGDLGVRPAMWINIEP